MGRNRIYFDNAATTWPKPAVVLDAVLDYMRGNGASAGRGSYESSLVASRIVEEARRKVAKLIEAERPSTIAFGFNGTDVLHLAIAGTLHNVRHVVTTAAEHNSVLRPLHAWSEATEGARLDIVGCDDTGAVNMDRLATVLAAGADLLVMTHASNVTGALQSAEEAAEVAHKHGVLSILDAAQTLGHEPISVRSLRFDMIASSGHKGLLGPLGTGVLYVRPGVEDRLRSIRQGGTGTESELPMHPQEMPQKLEAGNHNVPALAGLAAGITWIESQGIGFLREQQRKLMTTVIDELQQFDKVSLYGPRDPQRSVAVLSFNVAGMASQEVASILDSHFGIEVRSGLHCAPLAHRSIGTIDLGGTVRVSLGPFNTVAEIEQLVTAVKEIAAAAVEL